MSKCWVFYFHVLIKRKSEAFAGKTRLVIESVEISSNIEPVSNACNIAETDFGFGWQDSLNQLYVESGASRSLLVPYNVTHSPVKFPLICLFLSLKYSLQLATFSIMLTLTRHKGVE